MIKRDFSLPKRAHVELTSNCNFRCITCKHGYVQYGQDIRDDVCDILIRELVPYLDEVEMQGTGESLLSHNFNRFFDGVARNRNCKLVLITNGSLLNEYYIEKFIHANMQIVFSLDGADKDTFHQHRPVGDFDNVAHNIKLLCDIRRRTSKTSLSTVINMVLTKYNIHNISSMIDFAANMGIDYLFVSEVRPCMPDDIQWNNLRLDICEKRNEVLCAILNAENYARKMNVGFAFNPYNKEYNIKKSICPSPWQHVFVSADGNVSFCCELNQFFGNLVEQTFDEIWNGEKMNSFRNQMLMTDYHKRCLTCCLPWGITHE